MTRESGLPRVGPQSQVASGARCSWFSSPSDVTALAVGVGVKVRLALEPWCLASLCILSNSSETSGS